QPLQSGRRLPSVGGDPARIEHNQASLVSPAKKAEKPQSSLYYPCWQTGYGQNEAGGTLLWTPRKCRLADGKEGEGIRRNGKPHVAICNGGLTGICRGEGLKARARGQTGIGGRNGEGARLGFLIHHGENGVFLLAGGAAAEAVGAKEDESSFVGKKVLLRCALEDKIALAVGEEGRRPCEGGLLVGGAGGFGEGRGLGRGAGGRESAGEVAAVVWVCAAGHGDFVAGIKLGRAAQNRKQADGFFKPRERAIGFSEEAGRV